MTRLRATTVPAALPTALRTPVLTAVLLVALVACGAPDDAARAAGTSDPPSAASTPATPDASTRAASEDPLEATPRPEAASPVDGAPPALLSGPVDPALGPGTDVTTVRPTAEELAAVQADPSTAGADTIATLFTAAWGEALETGDATTVRSLAGPDCTFCTSLADNAESLPPSPETDLLTTIWPVTAMEPTPDYPYRVVVFGLEHVVVGVGSVGEAVHLEVLTERRQLVHVAVVWADDAWWVHGVDTDPWDGSHPLAF